MISQVRPNGKADLPCSTKEMAAELHHPRSRTSFVKLCPALTPPRQAQHLGSYGALGRRDDARMGSGGISSELVGFRSAGIARSRAPTFSVQDSWSLAQFACCGLRRLPLRRNGAASARGRLSQRGSFFIGHCGEAQGFRESFSSPCPLWFRSGAALFLCRSRASLHAARSPSAHVPIGGLSRGHGALAARDRRPNSA